MKNLLTGIIILVIVIGGYIFLKKSAPPTNTVFKIGSVLPLTGDYASVAKEINRGALLAIEETKGEGLVIEYISEDDQFEHRKSVDAANKLTSIDKVDAALTAIVTAVKPMAPIFNSAKIPLLAVWDSNEYIKTAGDYIFTIGFSTEENGWKMAEFAFNDLKLRHLAVMYQTEEWSELISKSFMEKFKLLGGTIVLTEKFQLPERDFRTFIAKAKNADVDGIYFPLNPNANSRLLIESKQLKFNPTFLTGDALIEKEIQESGPAAEGVYFTNVYNDNTLSLAEKYKTMFGEKSASPTFTSFGYDGVKVLVKAYKDSLEKKLPLREALRTVQIQTTGSFVDMKSGQYSDRIERIYQVKNGQVIEIKK